MNDDGSDVRTPDLRDAETKRRIRTFGLVLALVVLLMLALPVVFRLALRS